MSADQAALVPIALWIMCALLVFSPRKYDPAIRLKEWVINRRKNNG